MTLHRSLFMLVLLSPMAVLAAPCKPAIFPGYSWPSKTKEVSEAKKVEIAALEKYAFTLTGDDDARLGIRTDSVLIIKNKKILYKRYTHN